MKVLLARIAISFFLFLFRRKADFIFPAKVSPYFAFRLSPKFRVYLGKATLGRDVKISNGARFLGEPELWGNVSVGKYTTINGPATRITARVNPIRIGNYCSIAHCVTIMEFNHDHYKLSTSFVSRHVFNVAPPNEVTSKGGILIEDDVWIGSNVVILSGVTIGRGSVIAAGSVVTKSIPRYSIVAGNPGKVLKPRFSKEISDKIELSKWWCREPKDLRSSLPLFNQDVTLKLVEKLLFNLNVPDAQG